MELNDAIKAFDFLSKFNGWAFALLTFTVAVVLAFLAANVTDKIFSEIKIKKWIIGITTIFVIVTLTVLKFQAEENKQLLCEANNIKNYLLESDTYSSDYNEIARQVGGLLNTSPKKARARVIDVTRQFPDVFVATKIPYPSVRGDSSGVKLVDRALYTAMAEKLIPMFKQTILYYLKDSKQDTISFRNIRVRIDRRCDDYLLDLMIAKNSKLFTLIVAWDNCYDKNNRNIAVKKVGGVPSLRISQDSMKKFLGRKEMDKL